MKPAHPSWMSLSLGQIGKHLGLISCLPGFNYTGLYFWGVHFAEQERAVLLSTLFWGTLENLLFQPVLSISIHGLACYGARDISLQLVVDLENLAANMIGHLPHLLARLHAWHVAFLLSFSKKIAQGAPVNTFAGEVLACIQLRNSDWIRRFKRGEHHLRVSMQRNIRHPHRWLIILVAKNEGWLTVSLIVWASKFGFLLCIKSWHSTRELRRLVQISTQSCRVLHPLLLIHPVRSVYSQSVLWVSLLVEGIA